MPILSGTTRRKLNNAISPDTLVSILSIVSLDPYETVHVGDAISDENGEWSVDTGANEGPFIQVQWKKEGDQIIPAICNPYITMPEILSQVATVAWLDASITDQFTLRTVESVHYVAGYTSIAPGTYNFAQETEELQPTLADGLITFGASGTTRIVSANLGNIISPLNAKFTMSFNIDVITDNSNYLMSHRADQINFAITSSSGDYQVRIGGVVIATFPRTVGNKNCTFRVNREEGISDLLFNEVAIDSSIDVNNTVSTSGSTLTIGSRGDGNNPFTGTLKKFALVDGFVTLDELNKIHSYISE